MPKNQGFLDQQPGPPELGHGHPAIGNDVQPDEPHADPVGADIVMPDGQADDPTDDGSDDGVYGERFDVIAVPWDDLFVDQDVLYSLDRIECNRTTVTRHSGANVEVELAPCRCKLRLCRSCGSRELFNLREELICVLARFPRLNMLTLTVDPTLFCSPAEAYNYLRNHRCLSILMQDLRRHLKMPRLPYFATLEFQPGTGMPHYHVVVAKDFISQPDLLQLWGKHRPKTAGPCQEGRPSLGLVWVEPSDGDGMKAARTAAEYVTKLPENGYPDWVMEMGGRAGRIRWTTTSRFFFPPKRSKPASRATRGRSTKRVPSGKANRTYKERLEACGQTVSLLVRVEWIDHATGAVSHPLRWKADLDVDADELDRLRHLFCNNDGRLSITSASVDEVLMNIAQALGRTVAELRGSCRTAA
ncbi:MAG: hypothetical protein NTW19_08380 [Planctomycetota bacterium]|nr:hypothetical protein [Planctomycetota bacterium]